MNGVAIGDAHAASTSPAAVVHEQRIHNRWRQRWINEIVTSAAAVGTLNVVSAHSTCACGASRYRARRDALAAIAPA
jgi:hypothetical protein